MSFYSRAGRHKNIFSKKIIIAAASFIIAAAAFFSQTQVSPSFGESLQFHAIDVGQGDSFLFMFPDRKTILVDAGTKDGGSKVVRYLKSRGIDKIDLLVATHGHSDHIGGMPEVIDNFEIGKVWDSGFNHGSSIQKNFYLTIKKNNIPFGRPKRGYAENFGGAEIEVLAPAGKFIRGTASDTNNNSLVFLLRYGKVAFLMTGDMERAERASISPLPYAAILKAAHHGSSNGTDRTLLKQTKPSLVILSYARENSYGFPHREVVSALKKSGAGRIDTADGDIIIETDGKSITYPSERLVLSK
ncbi:MAG: MBL fold metallo-hydrolase [Synergistaceae bacterium]